MGTTENIAYSAFQVERSTTRIAPKQSKTAIQKKRRMSVEEYFSKVLKKLDEHYAGVQES